MSYDLAGRHQPSRKDQFVFPQKSFVVPSLRLKSTQTRGSSKVNLKSKHRREPQNWWSNRFDDQILSFNEGPFETKKVRISNVGLLDLYQPHGQLVTLLKDILEHRDLSTPERGRTRKTFMNRFNDTHFLCTGLTIRILLGSSGWWRGQDRVRRL